MENSFLGGSEIFPEIGENKNYPRKGEEEIQFDLINFSLVEKMILKLAFLFSFSLSFFSRERDSIRIACINILLESGFLMLRDLAS